MDDSPKYRDEMDFKELLRNPAGLFGYSFVYVLAALLVLGLYYINRLNAVGASAVSPLMLRDSSALAADIPLQTPAVLPPVDILAISARSDSLLGRGRDLYKANCASCHGDNGMGDGPAGLALNPKPRNFHSSDGWTNGAKISQIYRTLEEGIVRNGMASYNYMPPADRVALAHVVRSFLPAPPLDSSDELMALEAAYQLSKGVVRPGQIPVRRASGLYVAERAAGAERIGAEVSLLASSDDPGARILAAAAADPARAVRSLSSLAPRLSGPDDLMKAVVNDPLSMGFRPDVSSLTPADWKTAYDYLASRGLAGRGT